MSFLDQLTENDRTLLVSLPYRVGLYISQSDETGGDNSDEVEQLALSSIITAYSQEVFGAETVQYVINETVRRKTEWVGWSSNLDAVEGECHRAVDILTGIVDEKEVSAFRRHLVEIGESVALAFREYGDSTPFMDKLKVMLFYMIGKYKATKQGESFMQWEQFINISLDERKALHVIAGALNVKYT